jgi:hypothetical protein
VAATGVGHGHHVAGGGWCCNDGIHVQIAEMTATASQALASKKGLGPISDPIGSGSPLKFLKFHCQVVSHAMTSGACPGGKKEKKKRKAKTRTSNSNIF